MIFNNLSNKIIKQSHNGDHTIEVQDLPIYLHNTPNKRNNFINELSENLYDKDHKLKITNDNFEYFNILSRQNFKIKDIRNENSPIFDNIENMVALYQDNIDFAIIPNNFNKHKNMYFDYKFFNQENNKQISAMKYKKYNPNDIMNFIKNKYNIGDRLKSSLTSPIHTNILKNIGEEHIIDNKFVDKRYEKYNKTQHNTTNIFTNNILRYNKTNINFKFDEKLIEDINNYKDSKFLDESFKILDKLKLMCMVKITEHPEYIAILKNRYNILLQPDIKEIYKKIKTYDKDLKKLDFNLYDTYHINNNIDKNIIKKIVDAYKDYITAHFRFVEFQEYSNNNFNLLKIKVETYIETNFDIDNYENQLLSIALNYKYTEPPIYKQILKYKQEIDTFYKDLDKFYNDIIIYEENLYNLLSNNKKYNKNNFISIINKYKIFNVYELYDRFNIPNNINFKQLNLLIDIEIDSLKLYIYDYYNQLDINYIIKKLLFENYIKEKQEEYIKKYNDDLFKLFKKIYTNVMNLYKNNSNICTINSEYCDKNIEYFKYFILINSGIFKYNNIYFHEHYNKLLSFIDIFYNLMYMNSNFIIK